MKITHAALFCAAVLATAALSVLALGTPHDPAMGLAAALGVPQDLADLTKLGVAMATQTSYSETHAKAYAGMIANMTTKTIDSRVCETAAGIGFGVVVGKGSADNGAVLGAAAAAQFLGISVRDITLVNDVGDEYQQYDTMAVLTRGDIWVTVGGDVADGEDVTFSSTTGVLSSAGTSGSQFAIAGARWMTTASSGELAIVRLSGSLPSA